MPPFSDSPLYALLVHLQALCRILSLRGLANLLRAIHQVIFQYVEPFVREIRSREYRTLPYIDDFMIAPASYVISMTTHDHSAALTRIDLLLYDFGLHLILEKCCWCPAASASLHDCGLNDENVQSHAKKSRTRKNHEPTAAQAERYGKALRKTQTDAYLLPVVHLSDISHALCTILHTLIEQFSVKGTSIQRNASEAEPSGDQRHTFPEETGSWRLNSPRDASDTNASCIARRPCLRIIWWGAQPLQLLVQSAENVSIRSYGNGSSVHGHNSSLITVSSNPIGNIHRPNNGQPIHPTVHLA